MIPKRQVNLSSSVNDALSFTDPRLPDAEFEKRLVDIIYSDIVTSWTAGTDDSSAYGRAREVAQRRVSEAINRVGRADRGRLLCEARFEENCYKPKPAAKSP